MTYAYVTVSTFLAFTVFGYVLGRHSDGLTEASRTDSLTGLWNLRFFSGRLADEVAFQRRYGTPLSLLLVDLDQLKSLNDRSGHALGDRALCHVARVLRDGLRGTDVAARCGGDEFALLLPRTDEAAAAGIAARIRAGVEEEPQGTRRVTVSIGALTLGAGGMVADAAELMKAADQALHEAKSLGRNRVVTVVKGEGK